MLRLNGLQLLALDSAALELDGGSCDLADSFLRTGYGFDEENGNFREP